MAFATTWSFPTLESPLADIKRTFDSELKVFLTSKGNTFRRKEVKFSDYSNQNVTPITVTKSTTEDFSFEYLTPDDLEFLKSMDLVEDPVRVSKGKSSLKRFFSLRAPSAESVAHKEKDSLPTEVFVLTDDATSLQKGISPKSAAVFRKVGFLVLKLTTVACVAYFLAPAIGAAAHAVGHLVGHISTNLLDTLTVPATDVLTNPLPMPVDPTTFSTDAVAAMAPSPDVVGFVADPSSPVVETMAQATPDIGASSGWGMLIKQVLFLVDILLKGIIIFAGVSWMFGNRTRALETLLSGGIGYVIVRHHDDIARFFGAL